MAIAHLYCWQIYPPIEHRSHEYHYTESVDMYELILADQVADLPPPIEHRSLEYHYTKSVDMYELILADQVADQPPFNQP